MIEVRESLKEDPAVKKAINNVTFEYYFIFVKYCLVHGTLSV